ncbi:UvrD-helicase domain-containing protein [Melissococcus sp. OM08-11BH]|uniref:HelD family protein n=1 Tax=Melissococcus sp. OM08-11BH TaxID=2293110 RepID=UPI000E54FBAC|nr:UvrD-helicase domain-containing protein [Melissococcus sp. OM08-11BH]RGI31060.1 ATP-dependent DNA helicase IV [Melissococcus sp. OM08-11BH]
MSEKIRQQEEDYLKSTYHQLQKTQKTLSEWLNETKQSGQTMMSKITEDIKLNVDGISDKLDSFSQIEMKNREIDQYNIKIRNGEVTLDKVNRLLENPYFGKIKVDFLDEEEPESFYIGMHGFSDANNDNLIYDWRSPIAELFYNNEIGPSSYNVRGNAIETSIEERRQFVIEKDKLITYFDTMVSIQDDVLLDALAKDDTKKMRDITATIQKEQNVIIRDTSTPYMLVNGVAGSGKTSAIMQRIAYLLYNMQDDITSDDVLILSPNKAFIQYVSDVLPSLGEKNPRNMTLLQFAQSYMRRHIESEENYFKRISKESVSKETEYLRDGQFIHYIKDNVYREFDSSKLFDDITLRDKTIISKEHIKQLFDETPNNSPHVDRVQGVKQRLLSSWNQRLIKQSRTKKIHDQVTSLTEEQQEKYFGHLIQDDSEKSLTRYAEQLLRKKYKKVTQQINRYRWLNQEILFNELFKGFSGVTYQRQMAPITLDEAIAILTITHYYVERLTMPNMRFVLVDEVQDYTPAQLQFLLLLFPKSDFTMVGDENQAIFNTNTPFKAIEALFTSDGKELTTYQLLTSYRSTGAITKAFNELSLSKNATIVPIRPQGDEPVLIQYNELSDINTIVTDILTELNGETLTIIVKTEDEKELLERWFDKSLNVQVTSINLAKGLEFDNVLLWGASSEHYHDIRDQKILYTAFSRAMNRLYIAYDKNISPLLSYLF